MFPPVVLKMIQFKVKDRTQTPFGDGEIEDIITTSNTTVYKIKLSLDGVTAYCQAGYVMPFLTPVSNSEIPAGVAVRVLETDITGTVVSSKDGKMQIQHDETEETSYYTRSELCLATGAAVCISNGSGKVVTYDHGTYGVELDSTGEVLQVEENDVTPADLRLLSYLPKPMTSSEIFNKFNGKISHEQANAASIAASNAFDTISMFCRQNTSLLMQGQARFNQAVSLTDPEFREAAKRVEATGKQELVKLKELAASMKLRLQDAAQDSEVVNGSKELAQRSKTLFTEIGTSDEARDLMLQIKKQFGDKLQVSVF